MHNPNYSDSLLSINSFKPTVLGDVPLVHVRRAGVIESMHWGSIAVTNIQGDVVYAIGNPARLTFARSALKPFLAAPFFSANGINHLGLTGAEAALLCASHSGETQHADAANSILKKSGANIQHLLCGCHVPFKFTWFDKIPNPHEVWDATYHNCSGKHAGFIAAARLKGIDINHYIDPQHPVQIDALHALSACMQINTDHIIKAVDGCSAPTFAVPLHRLAYGFARLGTADKHLDAASYAYQDGLAIACQAMVQHPEMVSGEGRNDLIFSRISQGDWICKIGAEGVQAIAIRSLGLGIAIKIADGNMRALYPATVAVLEQLGLLNEQKRIALSAWANPILYNAAGLVVGDIASSFILNDVT